MALPGMQRRFIGIPVCRLVNMPTELYRLRIKKNLSNNHKTYFSKYYQLALIFFSRFAFNDSHLRSSLFCDVAQRRSVVSYRRFGTNFRSHLQGSGVFHVSCIGPKCPEKPVTSYAVNLFLITDLMHNSFIL
jgi:hypothetical protein